MKLVLITYVMAAALLAQTIKVPLATFSGTLRAVTKTEILVQMSDDETVSFRRSRKTKFLKGKTEIQPTEIAAGTVITIEARKEFNGDLAAYTVTATDK